MKFRNSLKANSGKTRLAILLTVFSALLCLVISSMALGGPIKPTSTSTAGSHSQLKGASPSFQNYVLDRPILWIPFTPENGVVATTNDGGITTTSVTNAAGTGNALQAEINTSGLLGYTADTSNDSVIVLVPIPNGIDLAKAVNFRVLFSNSETAATGTLTTTFTYEILAIGTSTIGSGEPDDAVDTAGSATADLAANVLTWGAWDTVAASTISADPGDDFLSIKCKLTLGTIADATVYGIQMRYYRKWL